MSNTLLSPVMKVEDESPNDSDIVRSANHTAPNERAIRHNHRSGKKRQVRIELSSESGEDAPDPTMGVYSASYGRQNRQKPANRGPELSDVDIYSRNPSIPSQASVDKHKPFVDLVQATQQERNNMIETITSLWGARWQGKFPRNLIPRGYTRYRNDGERSDDPRDWSTRLLHALERLSTIMPRDVASVTTRVLRKVDERLQRGGRGKAMRTHDVEAVIADVTAADQQQQISGFPPPSAIRERRNSRANLSSISPPNDNDYTIVATSSYSVKKPRTLKTEVPDTDPPIKTEEDVKPINNSTNMRATSDGGFSAMLENQKRMQEQTRVVAEAEAKVEHEKRLQLQMLYQKYGNDSDAPIDLS